MYVHKLPTKSQLLSIDWKKKQFSVTCIFIYLLIYYKVCTVFRTMGCKVNTMLGLTQFLIELSI